MKFKANFELNSFCKIIPNNKYAPEPVLALDEKKDLAHDGTLDYYEYNAGISFCEIKNAAKVRQNRFKCALGPEEYFSMALKTRELFMDTVCKSLQTAISDKLPDAALHKGTAFLMTMTHRINDILNLDIAYLGDSLAFLIIEDSRGLTFECLNTTRHYASEPSESGRIFERGGVVINGRLMRVLPFSRILGHDYFNLKKEPNKELVLRDPTFINRTMLINKVQRVRLLICSRGIVNKTKTDQDFIKSLYTDCRNITFEEIPYEITKLAKLRGATDSITCSLIDFTHNRSCIYQTLFAGNEGPEIAAYARKCIVQTLNTVYEKITSKNEKTSSLKREHSYSLRKSDPTPPSSSTSLSKEFFFNAIADQDRFTPTPSIQPAQVMEDEMQTPAPAAAGHHSSSHSASSLSSSLAPSELTPDEDHESKRSCRRSK